MTAMFILLMLTLNCIICSMYAFQFIVSKHVMQMPLKKVSLPHRLYSEFERGEPVKPISKTLNENQTETKKDVDDEEELKKEVSDAMRNRLKRELQSQGADPNYSAGPVLGNPILIISGIVAILVILGGKDVFY